jgi:hypothetical protein
LLQIRVRVWIRANVSIKVRIQPRHRVRVSTATKSRARPSSRVGLGFAQNYRYDKGYSCVRARDTSTPRIKIMITVKVVVKDRSISMAVLGARI